MDASNPLMHTYQTLSRRILPLLIVTLATAWPLMAQEATLTPFTPLTGEIIAGQEQTWSFMAMDGAVLSFLAQAESDTLDPIITLRDNAGSVLISNDDYDYPNSTDAGLQVITIPRTGAYTLTVGGVGDSHGAYTLSMTPGYTLADAVTGLNRPSQWQIVDGFLDQDEDSENLILTVAESTSRAFAVTDAFGQSNTYYLQGQITGISNSNGWIVGLTPRYVDVENYYAFLINQRGEWRFTVHTDGTERVIRDWITHPAIVAGATSFSLAVLVNEAGFDFFYNSQLIGRYTDTTHAETAQVGLIADGSATSLQLESLRRTTPLDGPIIPQQIIIGNATLTVQNLQRQQLIPAVGQNGVTIPESFVTTNQPGLNTVTIGAGQTYTNFALGANVSWQINDAVEAGCGLIFRATSATDYALAYVDQTGGFGISQRNGDDFSTGLFGQHPPTQGTQRLLVIVNEATARLYLNGRFAGETEISVTEGSIGNAAVNFEPTTTACQFNDTWVWYW